MNDETNMPDPEATEEYLKKKRSFRRKGWRKFFYEVNTLTRLTKAVAKGDYHLAVPQLALLAGTLGYVVSPVDAIPDVLIGIGFADDAALVSATVATLGMELINFRAWEESQKEEAA